MEPCPHCRTAIPFGASVCSGCQAERHEGPDKGEMQVAGVIGAGVLGLVAYFAGLPGILLIGAAGVGGVLESDSDLIRNEPVA